MLSSFLKTSGQTQAAFAAAIGISQPYLSQIIQGGKIPSLRLALRIERATGGAIPASSWIADSDGGEEAAA